MTAPRIAAACLLTSALLASGAALAGPQADGVAALKLAYLACDRATAQRRLSSEEMMACSVNGERLLREGFGGDWERLLDWWRAAREGLS